MSYDIVKRVTIKGDKIIINSACNNVRPLIFSSWEYGTKYQETLREKLFWLFKDVLDGNLHLQPSVNPKIKNALMLYYGNPLNENKSCYSRAEDYMLKVANEKFKFKREDFETEREFERAITNRLWDDKEFKNTLYIEAQHYAYDNVINPMVEAYLTDNVDTNKYVVSIDNGFRWLVKMNTNSFRYSYDRRYAKVFDKYDAWRHTQHIENPRIERA